MWLTFLFCHDTIWGGLHSARAFFFCLVDSDARRHESRRAFDAAFNREYMPLWHSGLLDRTWWHIHKLSGIIRIKQKTRNKLFSICLANGFNRNVYIHCIYLFTTSKWVRRGVLESINKCVSPQKKWVAVSHLLISSKTQTAATLLTFATYSQMQVSRSSRSTQGTRENIVPECISIQIHSDHHTMPQIFMFYVYAVMRF